jgi:HemK-like putative methylase
VNNKISSVDELLNDENIPDIVVKWGLKTVYNKMFVGSHRYTWQQYINDLTYRLKKNDYLDVVVNLPYLSGTDKTTPEWVRAEMIKQHAPVLDSLTIEDIRNGWKFCDACCGRGFIIFDVVERLVKRLGEEHRQEIMDAMYGIDIEPHFVKLLNALGYKNVKIGDASTAKGWKDFKKSYNCIEGNDDMFKSIVSNPPYIEENDPHLTKTSLPYEPISALTSGADGLNDIRIICRDALAHLKTDAPLMIEHGYNQGPSVRDIFVSYGYKNVETVIDFAGNDRVTVEYKR